MEPTQFNLLTEQPSAREAEVSELLLRAKGVHVERIVSLGQASPEGFWYDQKEVEWVMLVTGRARLTIAGETEDRQLEAGDAVYLPAGCRHRVAWTDPLQHTVWLALLVDVELNPCTGDLMDGRFGRAVDKGAAR